MNAESPPLLPTSELEMVKNTETAQELVRDTDFEEAYKNLHNEGLLEAQVQVTKEIYEDALSDAEFLTEKDWERITILNLYSKELAIHSIETYRLVRSKIENISLGEETMLEVIEREGVSLDEFYRACILHDIGKTAIPKSVLNYSFGEGDWSALFWIACKDSMKTWVQQHLGTDEEVNLEEFSIFKTISDYQKNPVANIPVQSFLPEDELDKLETRGISTNLTLRQILELHENASQKILEDEGLHTEAAIAGQHHNYEQKEYQFPISSQTLGIMADLSDLLRLADEEQALLSKRPYKEPFSKAAAYEILTKDAKSGAINKELTALWIQDELKHGNIMAETDEDFVKIRAIQTFMKDFLPHSGK